MNTIETRIGVTVRIRPMLESQVQKNHTNHRLTLNKEYNEIRVAQDDKNYKTFKFDKVLNQNLKQRDIFEQIKIQELINKVVDGYHSTIFAYGQTGSGKTYSMEGFDYESTNNGKGPRAIIDIDKDNQQLGIIPRTVISLFDTIKRCEQMNQRNYKVYLSYLEIYNEKIFDLLNEDQINRTQGLRIRWTQKDQFTVENLYIFEVQNASEAIKLFVQGIQNKAVASHRLNIASSRSHCILTLKVDSASWDDPDNIVSSQIQLVDLAGSEKTALTGAQGKTYKESIEINQSLFTLRQVITALSDYHSDKNSQQPPPFVPYRDSQLTSLLKQSIGGNSYCLMVACIAPIDAYYEENISTLNYATKAGYISNEPVKNEDIRIQIVRELKAKNAALMHQLEQANEHIAFLSQLTNEDISKKFILGQISNIQYPHPHAGMSQKRGQTSENKRNSRDQSGMVDDSEHNDYDQQQFDYQNSQVVGNAESRNRRSEVVGGKGNLSNFQTSPEMRENFGDQIERSGKIPMPISVATGFASPLLEEANQKGIEIQHSITRLTNDIGKMAGNSDVMIQRLIDSVTMVRDLLQSNIEMREMVDQLSCKNETLENELYYCQLENQEIREKFEIMENIFGNEMERQQAQNDASSFDWLKAISDDRGEGLFSQATKRDIINEIQALRKEKRNLADRVQQLEMENISLNSQINPNQLYGQPTRSHFNLNSVTNTINSNATYQGVNTNTTLNNSIYKPPSRHKRTLSQMENSTNISSSSQGNQQHQLMMNMMSSNNNNNMIPNSIGGTSTNFSMTQSTNLNTNYPGGGGANLFSNTNAFMSGNTGYSTNFPGPMQPNMLININNAGTINRDVTNQDSDSGGTLPHTNSAVFPIGMNSQAYSQVSAGEQRTRFVRPPAESSMSSSRNYLKDTFTNKVSLAAGGGVSPNSAFNNLNSNNRSYNIGDVSPPGHNNFAHQLIHMDSSSKMFDSENQNSFPRFYETTTVWNQKLIQERGKSPKPLTSIQNSRFNSKNPNTSLPPKSQQNFRKRSFKMNDSIQNYNGGSKNQAY